MELHFGNCMDCDELWSTTLCVSPAEGKQVVEDIERRRSLLYAQLGRHSTSPLLPSGGFAPALSTAAAAAVASFGSTF